VPNISYLVSYVSGEEAHFGEAHGVRQAIEREFPAITSVGHDCWQLSSVLGPAEIARKIAPESDADTISVVEVSSHFVHQD
jgi:hypothetical protein